MSVSADLHAVERVAECAGAAGVSAYAVALNQVVRGGRVSSIDEYAGVVVSRNDVPRFSGRPTNDCVNAPVDRDAVCGVTEVHRAANVRSNQVASDDRASGRGAHDVHSRSVVRGDDVSSAGSNASNDVPGRGLDEHAIPPIAQRSSSVLVQADVIALDQVAAATGRDLDAVVVIGDNVALTGACPAYGVTILADDEDPVAAIAQRGEPGHVGAYVVAPDHVAGCGGALDQDAVRLAGAVA